MPDQENGPSRAPKAAEKQRAAAFFNFRVPNPENPEESLIKSSKGLTLFDNQYTTAAERQLIALAEKNGGSAKFMVEARIVLNSNGDDAAAEVNLSAVPLL